MSVCIEVSADSVDDINVEAYYDELECAADAEYDYQICDDKGRIKIDWE